MLNLKNKSQTKIKLELTLKFYLGYIIFSFIFFGVAFLSNMFLESVFLFITYILLRKLFPKTFHTHQKACILLSISAFIFALINTIPIKYSMFFLVIVAFIIDYILFITEDYNEMKKVRDIKDKFDVCFCTSDEIRILCKVACFTNEETEIAVKMFSFEEKLSIKELSEYLEISFQSANNKKCQFKKRILERVYL